MSEGRIHAINVSGGGVPKKPRDSCAVRFAGLEGDWQTDREHHGGPDRAVSLYSLELIDALRAEGHPIYPGSTGENLTVSGMEWTAIEPGDRLTVGEAVLEIVRYAAPCNTISASFSDARSVRISQKVHPGWSRLYARVLKEGAVRLGDPVRRMETRTMNPEDGR
jgi:MOSC domain-containing protein YiiM